MKRQELAPAKVNLTLDVGARRPDGYHEVVSVMQSVALYDTVTMESGTGEGISLTCDDAAIPADGSNLAWRAAEVFFRTTGVACDGLHITLEKSIPSQAGLGGGSSDAAAVLRGLRKLYAPSCPWRRWNAWAWELGQRRPLLCPGAHGAGAGGRESSCCRCGRCRSAGSLCASRRYPSPRRRCTGDWMRRGWRSTRTPAG